MVIVYSTTDHDLEQLTAHIEKWPAAVAFGGGTVSTGVLNQTGWHTAGGQHTVGLWGMRDPSGLFNIGVASLDDHATPFEAGQAAARSGLQGMAEKAEAMGLELNAVWMTMAYGPEVEVRPAPLRPRPHRTARARGGGFRNGGISLFGKMAKFPPRRNFRGV